MQQVTKWQTDDGELFDNEEEASSHEIQRAISDALMDRLGFNTATADRIGRNWETIKWIIDECLGEFDDTRSES